MRGWTRSQVFGVQEIGGIAPLVFGQYGELSNSFECLIDTLAVKGCDQAADHYLLDVGPGAASVQKRLLRQRVNCCVARSGGSPPRVQSVSRSTRAPLVLMCGAKINPQPMGQLESPAPVLFRAVPFASNGYLGTKSPFIRSALPARSL